MRLCIVLLGALVAGMMVSLCSAAVGGPCDSSCNDKLNCCADQTLGNTCFNTTTHECTANKQICAKALSLCGTICYDGGIYDCLGTKLCPEGFQLCGVDQCFDTTKYACVNGSQILRTRQAAECNGVGYNVNINECVNSTLGPIRQSTPCEPHQELCGTYCYDPTLYSCNTASMNLTSLPGVCGQSEVWCGVKCYDPRNYTCVNAATLVDWSVGQGCPTGQELCGQVCYNPSANLACSTDFVICPVGMGVCNKTCYNTSRYDCLGQEIVMHPGYCPTGMGLCGQRCYNMTDYTCKRDLLIPAVSGGCATNPCLAGDSCCSDAYNGTLCFENTYYECKSESMGTILCGKGLSVCGTECFDPTIYVCQNNAVLCPSGLSYCNSGCFDASSYQCLNSTVLCPVDGKQCGDACLNQDRYICSPDSQIEFVVCGRGQLNCAGTCYVAGGRLQCINRTLVEVDNPTCPSGDCNGTCFDLARAYCVNGTVVPRPQCDDDEDLCFDTCYDTTTHVCLDDEVYIRCAMGMDRCNQTCYDEDTHDCVNGQVVEETCLSKMLQDCGTSCYNMTTHKCVNGAAYPVCSSGQMDCGTGCYNPSTQTCTDGTVGGQCTNGERSCGSLCYNPAAEHCDNNVIKPNSAALATISISLLLSLICITLL